MQKYLLWLERELDIDKTTDIGGLELVCVCVCVCVCECEREKRELESSTWMLRIDFWNEQCVCVCVYVCVYV